MLEIIYIVFMMLFLFGITIFVHEWGHFYVARKCGFQVDAFAIGMGPALFQKKINGVSVKFVYSRLVDMSPSSTRSRRHTRCR